ncbi:8262_t:CDS:2, partial [Gigaspora rosea]
ISSKLVKVTNKDLNDQKVNFNADESIDFNVNESTENPNPSVSFFNNISDIQHYESIEHDAEFFNYNDSQSNASNKQSDLYDSQSSASNEQSDLYDSQSNASDEQSDLSDITNVDINECAEYNDLLTGKSKEPEDLYQKFPSKEYAEFMHIVTHFQAFTKNLNLPNFGWQKEIIFEYEGLEYTFEFRTVLDGIHQILTNKNIIEEFIFEYKLSTDRISNQCQYSDIYDSNWWKNVEQNIPVGAYVMPIILYSDATLCDHLGKTSRHPIFMTLGNIPLSQYTKSDLDKFEFGAINGFTSKTYELLHKSNVKQPYRMTNKHNINTQMQEIICGFKQLKHCIYDYFQSIENWSLQYIKNNTISIEVFDFAYLNNNNKAIRASLNYHNQAIFSDVCVEMNELEQDDYLTDNGLCYAKILLIIQITSSQLNQKLELVLVHWYDFAYPSNVNNHYF